MADRYSSLFGSGSQPGYGPWEDMSPVLQRRRKPDGTYEHRPTPRPASLADPLEGGLKLAALGKLGEKDELEFRAWYDRITQQQNLNPNPDDPRHRYDYRAAYKAGVRGPGKDGHWPSAFKADDHPNRFVGIIDTKTGRPRPMAGGLEAVTPVETPDTSLGAIVKGALGVTGTTAADAMVGTARLPGQALGAVQATVKRGASSLDPRSREKKDAYAKLFAGGQAAPLPDRFDPLKGAAETSGAAAQKAREKLAEATQDLPTPAAVGINQVATMTGLALDASQYLGLGAGRYAQLDEAAQARQIVRRPRDLEIGGTAAAGGIEVQVPVAGPPGLSSSTFELSKGSTIETLVYRTKDGAPLGYARISRRGQEVPRVDMFAVDEAAGLARGKAAVSLAEAIAERGAYNVGSLTDDSARFLRRALEKKSIGSPQAREFLDNLTARYPDISPSPLRKARNAGRRALEEIRGAAPEDLVQEVRRRMGPGRMSDEELARSYRVADVLDGQVDPSTPLAEAEALGGKRDLLRSELRRRAQDAVDPYGAFGRLASADLPPGIAELQQQSLLLGPAPERGPVAVPDADLRSVRGEGSGILDAMQHAGSDVSPEALNRMASGYRYYRVTPGGEAVPILADPGAVDVRVNPGEVKVLVTPAGEKVVEQGRLNGLQQQALDRLEAAPPRDVAPLAYELPDEGDDILAQLGVQRMEGAPPAPGRQGGEVTSLPPSSTGSKAPPPFSGVYDDPMQAVLGPEVAREYRQLEETLRATTRERLAGRPGRLLPHQEDALGARMAEIQGSVTPEQWGFAVSGQGDIPPLPAGRVYAQEPRVTSSLGSYERLFPADNGGLRSVMDDLTPANDAGRPRPQLAPPGPEAQGGGVASADPGVAGGGVRLPSGAKASPPFNPESGAVSAEPLVRGVRALQRNLLSAGPYKAAAGEFPEAAQRAFVGETIPRRLEAARGSHALAMDELRGRVKQVERAAKAAKRRGEDISGIWDRISQARHGEVPWESLPEAVREPARRMWDQLDELSDARVAEGIVDPEDALDTYTHRAYRAFDDPEWARKVETDPAYRETWDDALALVKRQVPDLTDDEAVGVIQALVTRYGPRKMAAAVGAPKAANRMLNKRTLQSPEIRRVMGEYTDARVVAEKTVKEMSWDLEAYKFWKDIGDEGSALGVFRPAGKPTRDVIHRIGGGGEGEMASRFPSEDLLTREGLKRALTGSFEDVRSTWYSRLAGRVNLGKTVGSVATQARNFLGHPMTTIANGRTFWDAERHRQVVRILARRDLPRRRQAVRLGVLGQGATANEVGDFIRMVDPKGPVSRGLAAAGEAFKGAYAGSDDLWRTYNWLGETEDLMHARGLSRPEAEVLAADRVRDMVQTYDRAPKIAEKLRRAPFVGGLGATFYTETIRNVGNIARISADDIAYGMRQLRAGDVVHGRRSIALGMRRYTGLATALVSGAAIAEVQKQRHGISDEEEAAARRGLPRYDQNAELIFTGKDEAGLAAWDYSYANPYSVLSRPIIATQRSIEEGKVPVDAVYELMSALAGGDILATSAAEATFGREIQLWPPELGRPIDDRLAHLGRNIAPGTLNTAEQIASGRRGPEALLGVRTIKIDPEKGTRRQAGSLGAAYDRAASTFRRARAKDPERAVGRYLDSIDKLWKESRRLGKDTTTLGLEPSEAQGQLYALPREVRGTLSGAIRNEAGESGSVARPEGWDVPPLPYFRPKDAKEAELYRLLVARFKARYGIN